MRQIVKVVVIDVFSEDLIEARADIRFMGIDDEGHFILFSLDHQSGAALAESFRVSTQDVEVRVGQEQILKHYVPGKIYG